jgi:hypothetical protein
VRLFVGCLQNVANHFPRRDVSFVIANSNCVNLLSGMKIIVLVFKYIILSHDL